MKMSLSLCITVWIYINSSLFSAPDGHLFGFTFCRRNPELAGVSTVDPTASIYAVQLHSWWPTTATCLYFTVPFYLTMDKIREILPEKIHNSAHTACVSTKGARARTLSNSRLYWSYTLPSAQLSNLCCQMYQRISKIGHKCHLILYC